jgi:hypothetical protein
VGTDAALYYTSPMNPFDRKPLFFKYLVEEVQMIPFDEPLRDEPLRRGSRRGSMNLFDKKVIKSTTYFEEVHPPVGIYRSQRKGGAR